MTTTVITINTRMYYAVHGHTPRQSRQVRTAPWAFQIDDQPTPVVIRARYVDAVAAAKAQAQLRITVLP